MKKNCLKIARHFKLLHHLSAAPDFGEALHSLVFSFLDGFSETKGY